MLVSITKQRRPAFHHEAANEREVRQMRHETQINSALTIRRMDLTDADREALARLAELDSRKQLQAPVIGAEVEGRLLAAISVATGEVAADPFNRTTELRALLKLRLAQVEDRHVHKRARSRVFGRRSQPAVGGSPAGQLITLPRVQ
jgi:hypothetical protein